MKLGFKARDFCEANLIGRPSPQDGIHLRGRFELECYDKEGKLKWIDEAHNIITNEGLNHLLDVLLHASTQISTWYVILSETNTTPTSGLTYASKSFTEVTTSVDEATRQAYVEAAASSQSTTNSANKAVYTFNASKTIYGAALVGGGSAATTKGDSAGGGTLLCYALFGTSKSVVDDDVLQITYTISAADDGV